MCNAHLSVIYDMCEVVSWESIFFDENNIITNFWAGLHVAHDFIVPFIIFWNGFETNWMAFAHKSEVFFRGFVSICWTVIAVKIWNFCVVIGFSIFVDLLAWSIIDVCTAFFDKTGCPFGVV